MFVKICGMTRREDVDFAVQKGASAVGFIFAKSPRQVSLTDAQKLVKDLHIIKVGVFVNESQDKVREVREKAHDQSVPRATSPP